ncbi:hypothetical protein [Streptomyces sp. NPDC037389]|uniref:hypothetical protein n=1 Tax=Streptomyces sp. NPDC037389 TaxID=3155369 RepID=UPI0034108646
MLHHLRRLRSRNRTTHDHHELADHLMEQRITWLNPASWPAPQPMTPRQMQATLLDGITHTLVTLRDLGQLIEAARLQPTPEDQLEALCDASSQLMDALPDLYRAVMSTCDEPRPHT